MKKLTAKDGAYGDFFGISVAISDGTIVVGAHNDDDKGSNSGSAYVFEKSDSSDATSWTQVAKLTADDGAASDYFGVSVAISDGTIVVGAYLDDDKYKGPNSGSAYVFEKSDSSDATTWTQAAKLTADDGAASDYFGVSVAISDGTIVVGAYLDDDKYKGPNSGSASRRAILPTRPRGRKWRNSPPKTEHTVIFSVFPLLLATVPSSSEHTMGRR